MRLFFPSNSKRKKDQDEKLSALLQIKLAERPNDRFWADFDAKLHSKLIEPDPDIDDHSNAIYAFFSMSKRVISFLSCVACLIAIVMAFEVQDHDKPNPSNVTDICVKHFVKNELSCTNYHYDKMAYTSNNHTTNCYVSNSLGVDSLCWTRSNNSF
jgi:hypothetical protein